MRNEKSENLTTEEIIGNRRNIDKRIHWQEVVGRTPFFIRRRSYRKTISVLLMTPSIVSYLLLPEIVATKRTVVYSPPW